VSVDRQMPNGRWLPAEPMPEQFGVLWGRLWQERRNRGEWKWSALVASFKDARAIERTSRGR